MADADLQDPISPVGLDPLEQPDGLTLKQDEFHAEHEVRDAESFEHPADTPVDHDAISEDVDVIADAPSDSTAGAQAAEAEETADYVKDAASPAKPKSRLTVKPAQGKTSSAPPTPLVKKVRHWHFHELLLLTAWNR